MILTAYNLGEKKKHVLSGVQKEYIKSSFKYL